uniref:Uncharacterized protein n=1 Tax=Sphaerodactylus townsendi TaxID=933632 RepID=A0ACB8FC52_9SAUR
MRRGPGPSGVRCIQVQKIRYAWDLAARRFQKVGVLEESHTCADIHAKFGSGLPPKEQDVRKLICGPNAIDVEVTPVWKLLVKEVLNPFYVFQLFSVCLWLAEDYIEYSVAIILMSLLSIGLTVYDLRKEMFGYRTHGFRRAVCIAGYVLSCGVLLLVFYWKPAWDVWANCVACDLQEADVVLLRTTVGGYDALQIDARNGIRGETGISVLPGSPGLTCAPRPWPGLCF